MEKVRESQGQSISKFKKFLIDVNDFKIMQQIESGGFSLVYSVENIHNGKKSAAKVLNVHPDENKYKKMINTEISVLMRLQHPTIIKFHGYSVQDFNKQKNVTIFMELANKGSLAEFLKKIQLGLVEELVDNTTRQIILIGIARGMMYLHQHKLIHRDLKPGNILLDDQYRPYITDFGLSKLYESGHSSNQSQQCGTSMYMAPEVIEGINYNGKADVYSFGILMYELVTDSVPYPLLLNGKLSQYKFNKKVVEEDYRPEFNVPVKKSIENVIKKCWAKDPKERPTFESIYKMLAYNISDSIDDIYDQFEDELKEDNCDYYLDNVDADAVLLYTDEIENKNHDEINSKEVIESLIDPLKNENQKLKEENEQLKKELNETNCKIDQVFNSLKKENEVLKANLAQLNEKIIQIQKEKSIKKKFNIQEFNYQCGKEFDGIMKHLTAITGGNIHDNGTIEITSNSIFCDCYPRNVVDYQCNDNCYHSKDEPNTFICFDLKDCRIQLSSYSIKSCQNPKNSGHLRNWVIEASNDKRQWAQLDSHSNDSSLNDSYKIVNFKVANEREGFYRFIRVRQTGYTWYAYPDSHYYAYFIFIEFFGKLREPTNDFYNDK